MNAISANLEKHCRVEMALLDPPVEAGRVIGGTGRQLIFIDG
jgi:hypothetical protein